MRPRTFIVFAAAFVVYLLSSGFGHTPYDNYVRLAYAWLHGWIAIPKPPSAIDALFYHGYYYIIEPPMPAVLLLPLVAIFGMNANQSFACVIAGAVALAAADVLLGRMNLKPRTRNWVLFYFGFGTIMWWCTAFGAVWMYAHVVAAMFATLALAEWFGARRLWLCGLLLGCAALSRFPVILAALPFAVWLWFETPAPQRLRAFAAAAAGMAPLAMLYFAYNWARWHTLADIGYLEWYHQDQVGQPTGSPFRLAYLPFNLYSWFMLAPDFARQFPWLKPTGFGVSLTLTSPALMLAVAVLWPRRESLALWASIILVAMPSLLYYVNGYEQFGMRHSLDFLPFALPLVARGFERVPATLAIALVAYSMLANAYGMWYSWAYHAYSVVPH